MPRFYFDLREDGSVLADDDGVDFPNIELAAGEASRAAAEIVRDNILRTGNLQEIAVEVRNESGEYVLSSTLTLHMTPLRRD